MLSVNPDFFHPIGGAVHWRVNNWNNIPWYDPSRDLFKIFKKLTEDELYSVINYGVRKEFLELGGSWLTVRITAKWLDFYEQENKSWYSEIWEKYGKEIIVSIIAGVIVWVILYCIWISN